MHYFNYFSLTLTLSISGTLPDTNYLMDGYLGLGQSEVNWSNEMNDNIISDHIEGTGATFDLTFFDNSKVIDFDN